MKEMDKYRKAARPVTTGREMAPGETKTFADSEAGDELAHPLVPAKRVNGSTVFNQAGEQIGKIEDVVIDKMSGKVAYAILSFGGLLGMG